MLMVSANGDVSISRLVGFRRCDETVSAIARSMPHFLRVEIGRDGAAHQVERAVEHRDVDEIALAGLSAAMKSGQYADQGHVAGERVYDRKAGLHRLPVPLPEQLTNIMAATWSRGGRWSVDHLSSYCDELEQRVEQGVAVCPNERVRLLWVNNGLWFNTAFYRAFEEKYGAVFVWSMYSNFFSDAYRKYFDGDPLRALAARHISMNEQLHLPGWMSEWIIEQAKDYRADGAVMLIPVGDRMASFGTKICQIALEQAGIPTLALTASMVDERLWDNAAMIAKVGAFLEERVLPRL